MPSPQWRRPVLVVPVAAAAAVAMALAGPAAAAGQEQPKTGNMIFIHPDGTDAAVWEVARDYWYGPDALSPWDRLPVAVPYRGHASDQLTTSSNGGATTHAFGFKVDAPDSFGTDSAAEDPLAGDVDTPRTIDGLSGYPGSWLREAGNAGLPIGVVNDGDVAEPGTAAFLTEVTERTDASALEIARQLIQGRPGFDADDADPAVIMGGGEDLFFPEGTPICTAEQLQGSGNGGGPLATAPPTCVVHRAPGDTLGDEPATTGGLRTDGLNLAQAAVDEGYTLVRTRAEFDAAATAVAAGGIDPAQAKILALFASQDIFNAVSEEDLIAEGLVDTSVAVDAKETQLVLYGSEPGTPGYRPPTAPEMAALATTVLDAHSEAVGKPFATVWEVEGTDNMANINNSVGALLEARYANEMIGVARDFVTKDPATTVLTAADGDAGGLQAYTYNVDEEVPATVGTIDVNPTLSTDAAGAEVTPPQNPLDGRTGTATAPFVAEPDQFGQRLAFGVAWASTNDLSGGVVTRSEGLAADDVARLSGRFDNVDVYRIAYRTLFGQALQYPQGEVAPTRAAGRGAAGTTPGEAVQDRVDDRLEVAGEG